MPCPRVFPMRKRRETGAPAQWSVVSGQWSVVSGQLGECALWILAVNPHFGALSLLVTRHLSLVTCQLLATDHWPLLLPLFRAQSLERIDQRRTIGRDKTGDRGNTDKDQRYAREGDGIGRLDLEQHRCQVAREHR